MLLTQGKTSAWQQKRRVLFLLQAPPGDPTVAFPGTNPFQPEYLLFPDLTVFVCSEVVKTMSSEWVENEYAGKARAANVIKFPAYRAKRTILCLAECLMFAS